MTQKQANDQKSQNTVVKEATSPMVTPADTKENLRKVQQLLRETQGKKEEMLKNRNSSS